MTVKEFMVKQTVKVMVRALPRLSDKKLTFLIGLGGLIGTSNSKRIVRHIKEKFAQNHPAAQLARNALKLNPNCREKLAVNLLINYFLKGNRMRMAAKKKGLTAPSLLLISPTMRCNLLCKGCSAAEFTKECDLDFKTADRVIREAKELGIYFVTVSGGEPYVWPDLLKLFEKHNDVYFQTYTNGTLIDDNMARRLAKLGNVAPAISVEGFEKETDFRRGNGVFKKVMQAMDNLRKHGVLFGFSATPTRYNSELLASDEFVDFYINKGCKFGWYFQYIPIGLKPDVKMMATPEQREHLRLRLKEMRKTKPVFFGDFWNDGPYVKGCMAGCSQVGNGSYFHVNHKGDVEPCGFVHFTVDNIKNKPLKEVINSKFFKAIRAEQPYCGNMYMPCMIIDNPEILRKIVKETGARPSHPGADSIINDPVIIKHLDQYSKRMHELTDKAWKRDWPKLAEEMHKRCLKKEGCSLQH